MIKTISVISTILVFLSQAEAAPDPLVANARIALRLGIGKVLIVGGMVDSISDTRRFPVLRVDAIPKFSPAEMIREVTPENIERFNPAPEPKTKWKIGAKWQIYPGAGPPVTVVIEKVVLLEHGCGSVFDGAIGRVVNPHSANQIAGLLASEYLAVPGAGLSNVSEVPLMPVDLGDDINRALLGRARAIVRDENWKTDNFNEEDAKQRIRNINRSVLGEPELREIRILQWPIPGRKPLFFAQALWDSSGPFRQAVFAATAVLEKGDSWRILSFNPRDGEYMRMGEFQSHTWRIDDLCAFLNAWKIGTRYFVLTYTSGYEGYSLDLEELDFTKGLIHIFGFGTGC